MALLIFSLLLILGVHRDQTSGSGASVYRTCGYNRLELLEAVDGNLLLIVNQKKIEDSLLVCEVLNRCFDSKIREKHCGGGISDSVELHLNQTRKLLQLSVKATSHQLFDKGQGQRQERKPKFSTAEVAVALPGMFLLCCALMCPCFRAKRKDATEQHVLAKELSHVDSVSSEVSLSMPSERAPGTPHRVPPSPSRFSLSPHASTIGPVHLSISEIFKATQNFSPALKVGEGGFGSVYKAQLPDGQIVAIKRAKKEHFASLRDEFINEVQLLAKIEHRSLVKLLGYTDKGNERIMITEFVPNGTLREHLDGHYGKILDFNQRLEIAIDVAHGLTYLHLYAEKTIIHRDVKSSNILLTDSYRAKVSDFGFARMGPAAEQTHILTRVKGTAGYLDPEYLRTYKLTPKSDVYSFGILLIEILSGRRPVDLKKHPDERITVRWAFDRFNEGNPTAILDPLLNEEVNPVVLNNILDLAFQCAAPSRNDRPTMKEVGEQLWEIRKAYGRSHCDYNFFHFISTVRHSGSKVYLFSSADFCFKFLPISCTHEHDTMK